MRIGNSNYFLMKRPKVGLVVTDMFLEGDKPVTKKTWDNCAIFWDENNPDFRPIVFKATGKKFVLSTHKHGIKEFFTSLNILLKMRRESEIYNESSSLIYGMATKYKDGSVVWGCRSFTRKQLLTLRRLMKEHFDEVNTSDF